MKRVISTKVDGAKYAEFLEYCARENKYPANALRDALELLLDSDKMKGRLERKIIDNQEKSRKASKSRSELGDIEAQKTAIVKEEINVDKDEAELEI